jgi:hypothetical protein
MSFIREVFSDGGTGSASRVMMAFHAMIGAGAIGTVVHHSHAIPDAVTMAGLTAFVTAPYALNALHKAVGAIGGNGANPTAP